MEYLPMDFIVKRVSYTDVGTFGVIMGMDKVPFALTLEDPWNDNERNISCIPEGIYTCRRVNSPRFGNTFEVTNVENRSHILFHKGNTHEDTHGCILVGEQFGVLNNTPAILSSSKGYGEFMEKLEGKDVFTLYVVYGSAS